MGFLSNTNIKETDIADILNKYQESTGDNLLETLDGEIITFADFINSYFTRNASGNLEFKSNSEFKAVANKLGLTEEQI